MLTSHEFVMRTVIKLVYNFYFYLSFHYLLFAVFDPLRLCRRAWFKVSFYFGPALTLLFVAAFTLVYFLRIYFFSIQQNANHLYSPFLFVCLVLKWISLWHYMSFLFSQHFESVKTRWIFFLITRQLFSLYYEMSNIPSHTCETATCT